MLRNLRVILSAFALGAIVLFSCSASLAGTIIKLNLGGVGPDIGMGPPAGQPVGVLSTVDQTGGVSPAGDQLTAIEYTGFLNPIPDIGTNTASFSLNGLNSVGPANVFGSLVIQNFTGGLFSLYDPSDVLLLQGPLVNSALTGVMGPPGTGALFTTTLGSVSGGTLAAFIAPGSVSLSMNLTNVSGGAGFAVGGAGPTLQSFLADGSINISADPSGLGPGVPEPATAVLVLLGGAAMAICGRRRGC